MALWFNKRKVAGLGCNNMDDMFGYRDYLPVDDFDSSLFFLLMGTSVVCDIVLI